MNSINSGKDKRIFPKPYPVHIGKYIRALKNQYNISKKSAGLI